MSSPTDPYGMFIAFSRTQPAQRWRVHYVAQGRHTSCKGVLYVVAATSGVALRKAAKKLQHMEGLSQLWAELRG